MNEGYSGDDTIAVTGDHAGQPTDIPYQISSPSPHIDGGEVTEVTVTTAVQSLLASFDALSGAEQHEVVLAVLRRIKAVRFD